jgi:hypothetical protein
MQDFWVRFRVISLVDLLPPSQIRMLIVFSQSQTFEILSYYIQKKSISQILNAHHMNIYFMMVPKILISDCKYWHL